jgi:tetratricopeptide (TPR) repeat protein
MMKFMMIISLMITLPIQLVTIRYNYSYYGQVVHSAPGMTFAQYLNANTLGVNWQSPEDMMVYNDEIYVIDSRTNNLVIINQNFEHKATYNAFLPTDTYLEQRANQGLDPVVEVTLNGPRGLDIKESGIYIADTNNNRIVKLNHDFEVIATFSHIEDRTFDEIAFEPLKLTVDGAERMYVVARNVYEGIIELGSDGQFNRFTGVNPIRLTPVEIFRRSLMTEEQLSQLRLYLPTEYTNVSINDRSFIYATSRPSEGNAENMIQLINPKGVDVIRRNGYHPPMGDIHFIVQMNNYVINGPSNLVDIESTDHGIYTVLDQKRSRLFTYDQEGNLLYINGDAGSQSDKFVEGVAISYYGEKLLVLDRKIRTIVIYEPTAFGKAVNEAIGLQAIGEFDAAAEIWREVLTLNTNYEIAYNGLGKYYLRTGNYLEAMNNFNLGHDYYYYSKAYRGYRNEWIKSNFGMIFGGFVLVSGTLITLKIRKTYKKGGSILYED